MAAPLLIAGLITSGVSLLGSLFSGISASQNDPEKIYDAAKGDLDGAYKSVLDSYTNTFDESYKKAMALYPQAREKIMEAYSLEKNRYLKDLIGNLDQQRTQLDTDLERARSQGASELKKMLGGWVDSGRKAAQIIKQQNTATESSARARLEQDLKQNQLLSNVGLTQAGSLANLAGTEANTGAGAQLGFAEGTRGIGQQYLGSLASLIGQEAGQEVATSGQPTVAEQAFGSVGQVGGALVGAGLGEIDPLRVAGAANPAQSGVPQFGSGAGSHSLRR